MKFTLLTNTQKLLSTVSSCNESPICRYSSTILVQKGIIIARITLTNETRKSKLLTNKATSPCVLL